MFRGFAPLFLLQILFHGFTVAFSLGGYGAHIGGNILIGLVFLLGVFLIRHTL